MKTAGILINNEGNLLFDVKRAGGFITRGLVVGYTLYQNQFVLCKAQKGDIKEHPLMGVGLDDITNDNDELYWNRTIREEFARDGMIVEELKISNEGTVIKAKYK